MVIHNPKTEMLVRSAIQRSVVFYTSTQRLCDGHGYLLRGSFKKILNMFHDKRISFGNEEVNLQ